MTRDLTPILTTVLLSLCGVVGDYFLKLSSSQKDVLWNKWFVVGFVLLASTSFGWVTVMKEMKLASLGAIYAVSITILLAGTGTIFFRERLTSSEWLGLTLAVVSLLLLTRFSE